MLYRIVGQVDFNAALVLCVLFAAICIVLSVLINRKSKRRVEIEFELEHQKLLNDDEENKRSNQRLLEVDLARIATEKDVNFKRIESGLIEVHKKKENHDY